MYHLSTTQYLCAIFFGCHHSTLHHIWQTIRITYRIFHSISKSAVCLVSVWISWMKFHVDRCKVQINSIFQIVCHWDPWHSIHFNEISCNCWANRMHLVAKNVGRMFSLVVNILSTDCLWFIFIAYCCCSINLNVSSSERFNDLFVDYDRGQSFFSFLPSNALNWKLTKNRQKFWLHRNCATKRNSCYICMKLGRKICLQSYSDVMRTNRGEKWKKQTNFCRQSTLSSTETLWPNHAKQSLSCFTFSLAVEKWARERKEKKETAGKMNGKLRSKIANEHSLRISGKLWIKLLMCKDKQ